MARTLFQEKIHALLSLPDGIPPELDPWNDEGDPELYKKRRHRKSARVKCVETGVVYESAQIAAESVGLKDGVMIRQCCRGKQLSSGGYTWVYAE